MATKRISELSKAGGISAEDYLLLLKNGITYKTSAASLKAYLGSSESAGAATSDVNFYDYDGTCVASYTVEEAAALAALPAAPEHDGLIFQGWNWLLADIKAYGKPANIGAIYTTSDGATRLRIRIADAHRATVPLYFTQTVSGGVTIDWGDGTTENVNGTGNLNTSHQYSVSGMYTIALIVTSGTLSLGNGSSTSTIIGGSTDYRCILEEAYIGSNVTAINAYAFHYCYNLRFATLPNSVTSLGSYAYAYAYSLKCAHVPGGIANIGTYAFRYCYGLGTVTLGVGVTTISTYALSYCYALTSISLPDTVSNLGTYAFYYDYGLVYCGMSAGLINLGTYAFRYCSALAGITVSAGVSTIGAYVFGNCTFLGAIYMLPETPPSLTTTALTSLPTDCIIYVPAGTLASYQAATTWSTYANYMEEMA